MLAFKKIHQYAGVSKTDFGNKIAESPHIQQFFKKIFVCLDSRTMRLGSLGIGFPATFGVVYDFRGNVWFFGEHVCPVRAHGNALSRDLYLHGGKNDIQFFSRR
jgi:hypothetical protein